MPYSGEDLSVPAASLSEPIPSHVARGNLFSRISDLSSLSAGTQQLVQLIGDESDSLEDLHALIRTDPSLVAQILRRINSAYYGLNREIHSLPKAVALLGFREIRNLAITVYLARMFQPEMEIGSFSRAGLWNHSVAVAAAAHLVARVCGCGIPADAYIAGLLHDIGLLLVNRNLRRRFMHFMNRLHHHETTCMAEHQVYQFDHAQLGAHVAERWEFPLSIVDVIRYHHDATLYTGAHRELVYVVSMANYLCSRAGWTSLGVHNIAAPPSIICRALGLDELALSMIWQQLVPTIEKSSLLAQL